MRPGEQGFSGAHTYGLCQRYLDCRFVGLRITEHKSCCLGKIDDALTGLEFHIEQELLQVTVAFCAALDRYHGAVLQADARNGRLQEFQFIKALQRTVQLSSFLAQCA